jgi:ATP-dependent Clp protease ATP-binding subunit ClpB
MKQKKFSEIIRFLDTGFEIENVKNFCVDMTFLADKGYYDSFYVRKDIVDKVIVSLCRKNKSNVLLIGEPGVGKTAIV